MNGWPKVMAPLVNLRTSKNTAQIFCYFDACRDLRVGRRESAGGLERPGLGLEALPQAIQRQREPAAVPEEVSASRMTITGSHTIGSARFSPLGFTMIGVLPPAAPGR